MFCDTQLAARVERAEAELIARSSDAAHRRHPHGGGFVMPIAGGVASYAEPGSPLNKIAALGFADTPENDELAEVEDAFQIVGSAVQAEVATLADPRVAARLTGQGYRLESVVTTQPGSRSHHNVQRQGFDLLYTRAVLVRPADQR